MEIIKTKSVGGTSFTDHIIIATLDELIKAVGKPHCMNSADWKTQYEWGFKLKGENSIFTIYDWKEYHEIEKDETIEWHIGGYINEVNMFTGEPAHTDIEKVINELKSRGLDVR